MNALNPQTFQINQILNIKQVVQVTGLSRATIYAILDPKSKYHDATFPKQITLTSNRVGWIALHRTFFNYCRKKFMMLLSILDKVH
ncbi:AlpA family phage regulatory protein [Acinetobacter gerneri]|uniref:AlpA family phage regulatory protein n=1 Tax=Acinetobacter gerneri TaxID=202952 RepID=UPI0032123AA9